MSDTGYTYMNEPSINPFLKCKICLNPFVDPVITRDGERFCRICITQKTLLHNTSDDNQSSSFIQSLVSIDEKLLLDMLDALLVQCTKCQKINIRRIDFEQHQNQECPKRIISCKASDLKCPWNGISEELANHMTTCMFQSLRPILRQTLQHQKQFEQFKTYYDEQKHEIQQLKNQIEQYENRTERLQKGFKIVLELTTQQKLRFDAFRKEIEEQNIQRDELRNEVQQLKEQYNQLQNLSNEFQTELQQSINQQNELPNNNQQLNEQQTTQLDNYQKEFDQLKEQLNQQTIQFNQCQLEVKQLREHNLNYETQIKQFQQQDQSQQDEVTRIRKICNQHEIQIQLLARRKCVVPALNTYNDARIEQLIETFRSDSEIDLDGKQLIDRDMEFLCKKAIVDKQCRKLRLEQNDITAKGVAIIADTLYVNTTLVELYLSSNRVSDTGVHILSQVLSIGNSTLEWLELRSNNITDEGAEYLAEMLKTNKTITFLGLSCNEISDRGVRLLANAIANYNETLDWLNLSWNKSITDTSVDDLIEILKYNSSLKALLLNDCSLSKNATKRLEEAVKSNTNFILEV